jgi:hypothetical protein
MGALFSFEDSKLTVIEYGIDFLPKCFQTHIGVIFGVDDENPGGRPQKKETLEAIKVICAKLQAFNESPSIKEVDLGFEPNPFVRRVSHALAKDYGFYTYSSGEGDNKKVIVSKQKFETIKKIQENETILENFKNSSMAEMILPPEPDAFVRKETQRLAQSFGLSSVSFGVDDQRFIIVTKK